MMIREPFAALALVLLSTCARATSICRWVDERGRTQIAEVALEKYKKAAIARQGFVDPKAKWHRSEWSLHVRQRTDRSGRCRLR